MRVLGGIEQGHVGMLRADAAQTVHCGIGVELGDVTRAEFGESCGIVAEPCAADSAIISVIAAKALPSTSRESLSPSMPLPFMKYTNNAAVQRLLPSENG